MGPLPESDGFKHILLTGDQFSIWYEAVPMQYQEQGYSGYNFTSNLFKYMCKELGIDRNSTTAYHHQGNAMIERANQTIEESLTNNVGEHHNTWCKYPQLIMMAYRSSDHTVTKYSPYYLLFGASCALPIDCMYEPLQSQVFATPSDCVGNLKKELQLCHKLVRLNMEVEQERQKT